MHTKKTVFLENICVNIDLRLKKPKTFFLHQKTACHTISKFGNCIISIFFKK